MSPRRWRLLLAVASLVFGASGLARADQQQYVVVYVEFLPALQSFGAPLLQRLSDLGQASGAVSFTADQQLDRPNFYVLVEIWKNAAAYKAFQDAATTKALIGKIQRFLEAPFDERDGTLVE